MTSIMKSGLLARRTVPMKAGFSCSTLYIHRIILSNLFHAEIGKSSGLGSQGDDVGSKDTSYKLIKTQSEVVKAVEYLKSCSEVSLDLEFDRDRFAYGKRKRRDR